MKASADWFSTMREFFLERTPPLHGHDDSGENYARMLYSLARGCLSKVNTILEVGAGPQGTSGVVFAHAQREAGFLLPRIFSIEIADHNPLPQWVEYVQEELGVCWQIVRGDSLQVELENLPQQVDLLYIDGDHGGDHVIGDYRRFSLLVRPGGLVVFDDYPRATGVAAAVSVLRTEGVTGVAVRYNQNDGNSHYVVMK